MITDLTLQGSERIYKNLDDFSTAMRDRIIKKGLKAACAPVEAVAKEKAPTDLGTLKDAIGTKITSARSKGQSVRAYIGITRGIRVPVRIIKRGPRKGQQLIEVPTKYAYLVEFGHQLKNSKGQVIGSVGPKPFLRPAWDEFGGEVFLYTFAEVVQAEIASEVIKFAIYEAGL